MKKTTATIIRSKEVPSMLIPKNKQKEQARVTLTDHKGNIYMEQ